MAGRPPSRYRVVEEGRRLVVIDRWATEGRPDSVTPPPRPAAPSRPVSPPASRAGWTTRLAAVRRPRFGVGGTLTTDRLYDDKAPRTIAIDAGNAAVMRRVRLVAGIVAVALALVVAYAPYLLIGLALLTQEGVRKPIRAAITRWLDTIEREAG